MGSVQRDGAETVAAAVRWLDERPADRPFFLWLHLYDPHEPYTPKEPFRSRYPDRPYDGEVAYTDSLVGDVPAGARRARPPRRLAGRRHQRSRRGARRPRRDVPRLLRVRHDGSRRPDRQAPLGRQRGTRRGPGGEPRRPAAHDPRPGGPAGARGSARAQPRTAASPARTWPGIGRCTPSPCTRCCTTDGPRSGRSAPTASSSSTPRGPSCTTSRRIPPRRRTSTAGSRIGRRS